MRIRIKDNNELKKFIEKTEKRKQFYRSKIEEAEEDGNDSEKSLLQGLITHVTMIEKFLKTGHDVELDEGDLSIVGYKDDEGIWVEDDSLIILGY
jgi:hypothetical protein